MLTEEKKDKIIKGLQEWLATPGEDRTQSALAARTRVSKGMVSQLAAGNKIIGNSPIGDAHFLQLNEVLNVPLDDVKLHWATTKYVTIWSHLQKAKNLARRIVLAGDTGISKSYTAKSFARKQARVAYVRLTKEMGPKDLLNEVLDQMQLAPERKGGKAIMNALERKVTTESGWLLVFDECEDKKNSLFRTLKEIADAIEGKAGMALLGVDLIAKLGKQAARKVVDMPQLCRRFFPYSVELDAYASTDTVEVLNLMNISDKPLRNWLIDETTDYDFLHTYIADLLAVAKGRSLDMVVLNELFQAA